MTAFFGGKRLTYPSNLTSPTSDLTLLISVSHYIFRRILDHPYLINFVKFLFIIELRTSRDANATKAESCAFFISNNPSFSFRATGNSSSGERYGGSAVPVDIAEDKWQRSDVTLWESKSVDAMMPASCRSHFCSCTLDISSGIFAIKAMLITIDWI